MAWPRFLQRGTLLTSFSHHHVAVFLLTFFSYSLLHASRKTFSNVKVSISKQWTPDAFNTSIDLPAEIWSSNHLFPSTEDATLFLGTLDTVFVLLCGGPLHQWHHRGPAESAMGSVLWHVLFCIRGVCLWYSYGMAALLQQVVLLWPVDCERPAAVHWLALCGCCDGQLVWESWPRSCLWSLECLCFSGQYFGSMPGFIGSPVWL